MFRFRTSVHLPHGAGHALMPTSKDPKRRQAQLGNLRADAASTHGAYSEAKLGPLRARFAGELAEQFGSVASPEEIEIAADRRAASRSSMTGLSGAE